MRPKNSPVISSRTPHSFESYLAKTRETATSVLPGRTVVEHCLIAWSVAEKLISYLNSFCPDILPLSAALPAKIHDVGKICPTFSGKLAKAMHQVCDVDFSLENNWGGHGAVSYSACKAFGLPEEISRICGGHHARRILKQSAYRPEYGGEAWQKTREDFLRHMLGENSVWPDFSANPHLERIIAGLTIASDWIASGSIFSNPAQAWQPLLAEAVNSAGYIRPEVRHGLSFSDIFGFDPRPAQKAFYETVQGPGVYVLEAPMGLGKTEAALYAAYRMLEASKSTGIYFALPTCLTSNRIHHRVSAFLSRIFDAPPKVRLLHGKAWLERFLMHSAGGEAAPEKSWFDQGKRGILAPFGVGTIDQALLSVMNVKHGSLRTFGLTGKTVILDEVHSYDTYTGTLLDALTEQLQAIGCTVLILSATLTGERRNALVGRHDLPESESYPSILACTNNSVSLQPCPAPASASVTISHVLEDQNAIEEALLRSENAQRVLWIENTVSDAQAIYRILSARAAEINVPVTLVHSRFTPSDRTLAENKAAAQLSHDAPDRGRSGCIVVGTQVLEQSLDLDCDFLITRFCPSDMLLQRLGRLWRHKETRRPFGTRHEALLLRPDLARVLKDPGHKSFGDTAYVYSPYILYRSLKVWEKLNTVVLPDDIRHILNITYQSETETLPACQKALQSLEREKRSLRGLALQSESVDSTLLDDDQPMTRLNCRPEINVLLLRSFDRQMKRVTTLDGHDLLLPEKSASWEKKAQVAAMLSKNTVRVAVPHAFSEHIEAAPDWISRAVYCGSKQDSSDIPYMTVATVGRDESLNTLSYNQLFGDTCYSKIKGFYRRISL